MPRLPGVPFPEVTQTQVATADPSVNEVDGDSPADPPRYRSAAKRPVRPLPRYSPHERLITKVVELPLSAGARVTLQGALQCASKFGDVDGQGREGESFFWRAGPELAQLLGLTGPSFDRYRRELRDVGLLRWRRVNERELLPSGERARTPCLVFYVNVSAIRRRLNAGTELARCDQFDRIDAIRPEIVSTRNYTNAIEPPKDLSDQISDLSIEPRSQERTPAHPTTAGCDGLEILEALVDEWWHQLGSRHLPPVARGGPTVGKVRGAIAKALTVYGPDDVRDVIDAAADERVGGKRDRMGRTPHDWCRDRDVWDKGIFAGPFDRLLASAREARARRTRLLERCATANASIGGGLLPPVPPPQDQARINAAGAAELLAVLGGSKSGG